MKRLKFAKGLFVLIICLPTSAMLATEKNERYEFNIPIAMEKTADESGREWKEFIISANSIFKDRIKYGSVSYSGINDEEKWKTGMWRLSFPGGVKLKNSELPKSLMGTKIIGDLILSNQELADVDFLSGVEEARYNLYIDGNKINNLKGMRNLKKVHYDALMLRNNNLTTLDGLQSLRDIRQITLHGNPSLYDISALKNIESYGTVYFDKIDQYKIKPRKGSPFCNSIKNKKVYAKERVVDKKGNYVDGPFLTEDQICM
ncbi:leucine-rich repeat domain-containing protein [Aeromonas veronii]|uniref:Leucine-rich repeat domain-containing protein n=1 Tax=Aeromonas veronii TaxID=654 RepID=A0A2T4MZS1_AERVE|nr:leucine-rich repeat domain-containing protein [Aeromonas veronii]PTH80026.1 hypothetical protein DAA48_15795 [Aeromonas veronii]